MTAFKVLGILFLLFFLIGLVRVGGMVEYTADGLRAWVRLGAFHISVFPLKKKEKKEKKPKKKKEKKPKKKEEGEEEAKPKTGGPFELVKRYFPLIAEAAGALKRRIRIDDLELFFTAGGWNAANTAKMFGYSNIAVGVLWPLFEHNFEIKDYRVRTAVDFTASGPTVWIRAALSARIGQLVSFAVRYGVKFFKAYLAGKKAEKARKG